MRIKQNKSRSRQIKPLPSADRSRAARRWQNRGQTVRQMTRAQAQVGTRRQYDLGPVQWAAFLVILAIAAALIALIWMLTGRAIDQGTEDIRARTEQQVKSLANVVASDLHEELQLVDQSLAIIQEGWNENSSDVDLARWRKNSLALTTVADDIFIANERHIIVQSTLPQAVGQGFGSAYVSFPNGGLELFEPDGSKSQPGRTNAGTIDGTRIEARQFLMYVVRPLTTPRGFLLGASFRSEEITKLFAGANLGPSGAIGLVDLNRGAVQAYVGPTSRNVVTDIAQSELTQMMRKNESGAWSGVMPTDKVNRIVAWRRIADRPMSVLVGMSLDSADQILTGLTVWANGLAALGSVVVAVIAGILIWGIATARAVKMRERARQMAEVNLVNTRQELDMALARARLNAAEVGTLMSSTTDGAARIDESLRLRHWNPRFAQLARVPIDTASRGVSIEDFMRFQANSGVFGEAEAAEHGLAARITVFHTGGQMSVPLTQLGPAGEELTMLVRPVFDGGYMIILVGSENAELSRVPSLEEAAEAESV